MRRILFSILFLSFFVIGFTACNNDDDNHGWYDSIPNGSAFLRANTVRFYYIDIMGESLIQPDDSTTFPVTYGEVLENPEEKVKDYNRESGYYNGNHNSIHYDPEERLYYCMMTAYGDERLHTFSYPVYVNGDKDQIAISYKYTDRDVCGGKYWAKIISWKYNGKQIYSDDDKSYTKVFITKANGKTIVSLKQK